MQDDAEIDHHGIDYIWEQFADAITGRIATGYLLIEDR